jgi:prepilin-type N-terminal cleavage/methylation domain-containing protein
VRRAVAQEGATLVELLIVLAILGVVAGVVGLAARGASRPEPDDNFARIAAARREAVASGRPVGIVLRLDGRPVDVSAWPDGSVRADTALAVDPLTGRYRAAP